MARNQNISDTRIELEGGDDNLSIDTSASSNNHWWSWDSNAYAVGVENSSISSGNGDDTIAINASADNGWNWWGGNADAVAVDNSSIDLGSGNDRLFVSASATGAQTSAWAVRNSSIDTGSGDDFVSLSASTLQTQWNWDPAYGADNSSIDLGSGNDILLIDAHAAGQGDIEPLAHFTPPSAQAVVMTPSPSTPAPTLTTAGIGGVEMLMLSPSTTAPSTLALATTGSL